MFPSNCRQSLARKAVPAAARNITLDKPPPDGLKLPPVEFGLDRSTVCWTQGCSAIFLFDVHLDWSADLAFFRRVLNEGHSLIVVRAESSQIAASSCEILDRLGLGMKKSAAPTSLVSTREMDGPVIADFVGKNRPG